MCVLLSLWHLYPFRILNIFDGSRLSAVVTLPLLPSDPTPLLTQAQREAEAAAEARAAAEKELARINEELAGAKGETEVRMCT